MKKVEGGVTAAKGFQLHPQQQVLSIKTEQIWQ